MKFVGNAKSDPNAAIPADDYFMTCTNVQDKDKFDNPLKSKNGNDMWILEMTVGEGPHTNRKMWHYMVFLSAGVPGHGMTLKTIKAFGYDPEGDIELLPGHLKGNTVKVTLGVESSEEYPEPKNVIKKWHTPPDALQKIPALPGGETGDSQGSAEFDPTKLEKESVEAGAAARKPAPAPTPTAPAPAPAKKPLWGKNKTA